MDVEQAQSGVAGVTAAAPVEAAPVAVASSGKKSSSAAWLARIERCKTKRRKLIREWSINVDYRRGKPFDTESDEDRIAVPTDWSQTKAKQAQLFSQVPQVVLEAEHKDYRVAVPVFQKMLNTRLKSAKVGVAMDECLPDVINASGIAAVIVSFEARTVDVQVPEIDVTTLPALEQLAYKIGIKKVPMRAVKKVVDSRFLVNRVSPADLLWPTEFMGSDFDEAPWVGRSGRMSWADAVHAFPKLVEADRTAVVGDDRSSQDRLTGGMEQSAQREEDVVAFDEIFYKRHMFDTTENYYAGIQRMVFVKGKTEPVVDEPWSGQQMDPQVPGGYLGACKYPIRVLTLTYISDEPLPPSDSAIGRPQVDEMIKSRSQIMKQREHSIPVRWFDVNRIDPTVQTNLMQGVWNGFIPTQGDGNKSVGEIARANYPRDNFEFDRVIKSDLNEAWQVGPNQLGAPNTGERSASEANITQQNFQTRIGYERSRCVNFFVGISEVMAGLMALYDTFDLPMLDQDQMQRLQNWDRKKINQEFVFSIRADSTVLLDSTQRLNRLEKFLNLTGPSGYVEVLPIIEEMAALSGLDPAEVVRQPQPKKDEPPNISYRFSGPDITNPINLAILVKAGAAPGPEDIAAAQKILDSTIGTVGQPPAPVPVPPPQPGGPQQLPPPGQAEAPDMNLMDVIDKRRNND